MPRFKRLVPVISNRGRTASPGENRRHKAGDDNSNMADTA